MKKKIFAIICALVMCAAIFTVSAFAALDDDDEPTTKKAFAPEIACDYSYDTLFTTLNVRYSILSSNVMANTLTAVVDYPNAILQYDHAGGTMSNSLIKVTESNGMLYISTTNTANVEVSADFTLYFNVIAKNVSFVDISISCTGFVPSTSPYENVAATKATRIMFCNHPTTHTVTVVEPTCVKAGRANEVCDICKRVTKTVPLDIGGHTIPDEPLRTVAPTCDMDGLTEYKCMVCKKLVTMKTPNEHRLGAKTKIGNTWCQTCTICKTTIECPTQCEHSQSNYVLKSTLVGATCLNNGVGIYECKTCHATASLPIQAEHEFEYSSATVTSKGREEVWICSGCGLRQIRVVTGDAHTHVYTRREEVVTAATCTTAGKKKVYCSVSGCALYKEVDIPKTEHKFGEWTIEKQATCTEAGSRYNTCSVCQQKVTETIAKLDHTYGAVTHTDATCLVAGGDTKTCTLCGHVESTVIPASTSYCIYPESNYVLKVPASCTSQGYYECVCSVCGITTSTRMIPINPEAHAYSDWVVESEATCISTGVKRRTCQLCQNTETVTVEAPGHDFLSESQGNKTIRTCRNCGMTETVVVAGEKASKRVSSGKFSVLIDGYTDIAERDVFFSAETMSTDDYKRSVEPFGTQLSSQSKGTIDSAYVLKLRIGDVDASVSAASEMTVDVGEENKNKDYTVWYLDENGSLNQVSTSAVSRKGTVITVKIGGDTFQKANGSIVLVCTGEKKGSVALPITIAILTCVIGAGVVFFYISKSRKSAF